MTGRVSLCNGSLPASRFSLSKPDSYGQVTTCVAAGARILKKVSPSGNVFPPCSSYRYPESTDSCHSCTDLSARLFECDTMSQGGNSALAGMGISGRG